MNRRPPQRGTGGGSGGGPGGGGAHSSGIYTVEGQASVAEYLRHKPDAVVEILAAPRSLEEARAMVRAAGRSVPVRERRPEPGPGRDDGGARVSPVAARVQLKCLGADAITAPPAGAPHLLLALDHVQDPRNLGAIMRSAAFFGVRTVVAPERRQATITQAAVSTAQGGFALADLVAVVNLARTLQELKDDGYWIVGLDMGGEPLSAVAGAYERVVLVLGSEGEGLSQGIRKACDRIVAIQGRADGLDSLNVSVATGIALHAFHAPSQANRLT